MANEAALRDRMEDFSVDFTCGDNNSFEKGAIVKLIDPRTASGAAGSDVGFDCAGIVAREKASGSGRTSVSCHRRGIFDVHASGAVGVGDPVMALGNNDVAVANAAASGAAIIGHALEAASDDETFQIQLQLS